MDKKLKYFFAVGLIAIAALSYWGIKFNNSYLEVTSTESDFIVDLNGKVYECQTSCNIKLAPKSYDLIVSKDGFTTKNEKLFLIRGKQEKIEYAPIFIPVFSAIETTQAQDPYLISTSEPQTFSIMQNQSLQVVSTFKNKLDTPAASLTSDLKYAFISGNISTTPEFYLIDTEKQSRKKIDLDLTSFNSETPLKFKLLNSNLLLIESDRVYLYTIDTADATYLPVNTLDAVKYINENKLLILTGQSLDDSSVTVNPLTQLGSFIDKDETDIINELKVPADKVYFFDRSTRNYTFLAELPIQIKEPFAFELKIINDKPIEILTTQQESFQIGLGKN